jgi:hypothetical protein
MKIKRLLNILWTPITVVLVIILIFIGLLSLIIQPLIGTTSYLYNWDQDRSLKEEVSTANILGDFFRKIYK